MRRMIRLAANGKNAEGPLSTAVEQVPYPVPADPFGAWAVTVAHNVIVPLRQYRSADAKIAAMTARKYPTRS